MTTLPAHALGHEAATKPADTQATPTDGATVAARGRIGPNAILQVVAAATEQMGPAVASELLVAAGLEHYGANPPGAMVDEREVVRLHRAVRASLPPADADHLLAEAGDRTAAYILAHRIPAPVRILLQLLPPPLAARLLLRAIARHAWTFAGSGRFGYIRGRTTTLVLADCPACYDVYPATTPCIYYTHTMQGLFRALVNPQAQVIDDARPLQGGRVRRFRLSW